MEQDFSRINACVLWWLDAKPKRYLFAELFKWFLTQDSRSRGSNTHKFPVTPTWKRNSCVKFPVFYKRLDICLFAAGHGNYVVPTHRMNRINWPAQFPVLNQYKIYAIASTLLLQKKAFKHKIVDWKGHRVWNHTVTSNSFVTWYTTRQYSTKQT